MVRPGRAAGNGGRYDRNGKTGRHLGTTVTPSCRT
jgi:hypothetical protein